MIRRPNVTTTRWHEPDPPKPDQRLKSLQRINIRGHPGHLVPTDYIESAMLEEAVRIPLLLDVPMVHPRHISTVFYINCALFLLSACFTLGRVTTKVI
jgi:hypothetical protein